MSQVAFACPLYDMKNHFELALNLYKSKNAHNIDSDFYFVFSNFEQKDKFERMVRKVFPNDTLLYLIIPEEFNNYKAKAVSKKFYALESLKDKYKYIILTDCESLFIKECDFDKLAEDIWLSKSMLNSNKSPDGFFIMRTCFKTMGIYKNLKLRKDTRNYTYNFWFNDLQVYKCDNLTRFFSWLNEHNKEKVYDEYLCFEYYVYYAFLLLEENIHIKRFKYESMGGINEYLFRFPVQKQEEILTEMGLHWSSSREATNDKTVMLFHLDRGNNSNDYAPEFTLKVRFAFWVRRLKCIIEDVMYHD